MDNIKMEMGRGGPAAKPKDVEAEAGKEGGATSTNSISDVGENEKGEERKNEEDEVENASTAVPSVIGE